MREYNIYSISREKKKAWFIRANDNTGDVEVLTPVSLNYQYVIMWRT